jgi:hypothetical protein
MFFFDPAFVMAERAEHAPPPAAEIQRDSRAEAGLRAPFNPTNPAATARVRLRLAQGAAGGVVTPTSTPGGDDAATERGAKKRRRSTGGDDSGRAAAGHGAKRAPLPALLPPASPTPEAGAALGQPQNSALPTPPDKTTGPRTVDSSGSPRAGDSAGQPSQMTDVPVTPPAPEGRDQLDPPGRTSGRGIPPAPEPRKVRTQERPENRAVPPPPLDNAPDMNRSPWGGGSGDFR